MPHAVQIVDRKATLRAAAKQRRAEAAAAHPEAGEALAERVLATVPPPAGAAVSCYWPIGSEIDTRPLMTALHRRGHAVGLPVMVGQGAPLLFRAWTPGAALEPGGFGTQVPGADADEVVPDYLLVPLLAFDRAGYRLGYGGGFYDRTLRKLRDSGTPHGSPHGTPKGVPQGVPLAIGVAFAGQQLSAVPREPTDEPLDWVVTEAEAIAIASGPPAGAG